MKETTVEKIERVKQFLDKQGVFYTEFANGHLKVDKCNLWATSEKWNNGGDVSGVGLNSFIQHLKSTSIV